MTNTLPVPIARSPLWVGRPADRHLVECAINRLEPEAPLPSGPELDALVLTALGWEVRTEKRVRTPARRCRSPWSSAWLPLPMVSASADLVAGLVVPEGWDSGCGKRRGHYFGWCGLDEATFFECSGTSQARALLKAALFARRHVLLATEAAHG